MTIWSTRVYKAVATKAYRIENIIYKIRGVQVMLDLDLARLYECAIDF